MKIRYSVIITLLVGLLALACASEEKQEGDAPEIISAPSTATENTLLSFLTDDGCDIERHCRVFLGGRELPPQVYKQVTQPASDQQPTAQQLGKSFEIAVTVPAGSVLQCNPQNITGTGGCLTDLYVQDIAKRKSTKHFVTIFEEGAAPISQCVINSDCQQGHTCINGKCYPTPTPSPQGCLHDNDCGDFESCYGGKCKQFICESDEDCIDQQLNQGVCNLATNLCSHATPEEPPTPREIIESLSSFNIPDPPYGGTGGSDFEEECQNGYVVTGIQVYFADAAKTHLTGLRLGCTAPLGDKYQGTTTDAIGEVGNTTTNYNQLLMCPNSFYTDTTQPQGVVTGLHAIFGPFGNLSTVLRGLQLICGQLTQDSNGDLSVTYDDMPLSDCVGKDCVNMTVAEWRMIEIVGKIISGESVNASLSTTGYEHYARVQVPNTLLTGYHGRKGALIDALGITYKTMP